MADYILADQVPKSDKLVERVGTIKGRTSQDL